MSEATKWLGAATRVQTELEMLGLDMDELAKMLGEQDLGGHINHQQVPELLAYNDDYTVFRCPYYPNTPDDPTWIGLMRMPRIAKPDTWRPPATSKHGHIRCATLAETEKLLSQLEAGTGTAMAGYTDILVLGTRVESQTNPGRYSAVRVRYDQRACCWFCSLDDAVAENVPVHQVLVPVTNRMATDDRYHQSQCYVRWADGKPCYCNEPDHVGCVSVPLADSFIIFHTVEDGRRYETIDRS